ncbi:hypothetical protein [Nocardia sp. BMG111209]|uniref:hypothetical protein n=1 Tax=Nocardia sp. BMG111209 TaxID=1160137 RepID=UPI0003788A90|nr:hypothetical protein [Nocardia sp. BMG111209]
MFRTLVELITTPPGAQKVDKANAVLAVHPLQLSRWLEEIWARGGITGDAWKPVLLSSDVALGDPAAVTKTRLPQALLDTLPSGVQPMPGTPPPPQPFTIPGLGTGDSLPPPVWEHLMYAYLIEATGIFEILGEVVRRLVVGETLPAPSIDTMVLTNHTEELFYRDPPLFGVGGLLTSQLRPDARINRRNVYWRMFGMDLPHPPGPGVIGQPWKRDTGSNTNQRFLELWNELLRQVWLGIENDKNSSGPNATDAGYVGYLCQTLGEMLQLRRRGGMLSREEFAYVTMMSWFHLIVEYDTTLVTDLHADAGAQGNPADRLAAIGTRVGIAPSRQARELFELADLISPLLWFIELGKFNTPTHAELLYRRNLLPNPVIATSMNRIVDLWQSGTGERVKDLAVTVRRQQTPQLTAQPARLPGNLVPSAPSGNGHKAPARAWP